MGTGPIAYGGACLLGCHLFQSGHGPTTDFFRTPQDYTMPWPTAVPTSPTSEPPAPNIPKTAVTPAPCAAGSARPFSARPRRTCVASSALSMLSVSQSKHVRCASSHAGDIREPLVTSIVTNPTDFAASISSGSHGHRLSFQPERSA